MSSHFISLEKAIILNERFRNKKEAILDPEFKRMDVLPICETFKRNAFDDLLSQDGCVGIRFYLGMDDEFKVVLVAVGVNENDEDMLPVSEDFLTDENKILENGYRCPTTCPPPSVLNLS